MPQQASVIIHDEGRVTPKAESPENRTAVTSAPAVIQSPATLNSADVVPTEIAAPMTGS